MANEGYKWDFFVSYTQADCLWAEWIADFLEAEGYAVTWQERDCVPGTHFPQYMQDAIVHSERTIAVCSDAYCTSSAFGSEEWLAAWVQDHDGAKHKLLPVRVCDCAPSGLLAGITRFDLFELSEEQAERTLREMVASAVSGQTRRTSRAIYPGRRPASFSRVRFPGNVPSHWVRVPPQNPNFTGRDDELLAMRTSLNANSAVTVYTVEGLGGVGKTDLATEYANRFNGAYDVVCWIAAETDETIPDHFAALATNLGLDPIDRPEELCTAVHDALRAAGGWLLIFDNAESVEDIKPWLPSGPVPVGAPRHVIITTRRPGFRALGKVHELDVLDEGAAVRLLQTRVPDLDEGIAASIADVLDGLPLALEQAAAYLDETKTPPEEYLDALATRVSTLWEALPDQRPNKQSVATVWELSLQRIREQSLTGRQILDICAYFAPERIPLDLFTTHPGELPEPLRTDAASTVLFNNALATIRGYSMAQRTRDGHLQLHRLVQAALRTRRSQLAEVSHRLAKPAVSTVAEPATLPADPEDPLATALAVLCAAAPPDTDDPQYWPRWAALLPHMLAAVRLVDPAVDVDVDVIKNASWLQDRAHRYLRIRLEDITGADAQNFVRARNELTVDELCDEQFEKMRCQALEVFDAKERIPYVYRRGEHLYGFWRDAVNPRGLWRRTTLQSYRTDEPDWEVLIDVDELAEAEGEKWVWAGAILEPAWTRALVTLSRGGDPDATVVREFDMPTRQFVPGGFELPEAKSYASWHGRDSVLVSTDFGPGSLTDSGFPRIVKRWHRGQKLSEATTLFTGERSDVAVSARYDPTPGFERLFIYRDSDFFNQESYELRDEQPVLIDVPTDAVIDVHREWLLIQPSTPWTVGGQTYADGSLLAANYDEFLSGTTELSVVFEPDEQSSLVTWRWTRDRLILLNLRDVASHVEVVTPGSWERRPVQGLPPNTAARIVDADEYGDEIFLHCSGFDTPSQQLWGHVGDELVSVKSEPPFFDTSDIMVAQHFVASDDGTMIPYFVVGRRESLGPQPTVLFGDGGFGTAYGPYYDGIKGRLWLERGGTYVLANIRGGGEYGPRWHNQARRENRHKVYEDFAAVARDLVVRGITTVDQLGAWGSGNGGLLIGVMLTRYPELFGALVCDAPLLDMERFHLLMNGRAWVAEYGDPDNPEDWAFMAEFSPFQNISADPHYPPLLITTSKRDRVHPAHGRKMTHALETAGQRVLYYEDIDGGGAGAADNAQAALNSALRYSFLWRMLGESHQGRPWPAPRQR